MILNGTFKGSDIERNSALSYRNARNKLSGMLSPSSNKMTNDKSTSESKDHIFGRRHHSTIEEI
jgi:hypothetical protein